MLAKGAGSKSAVFQLLDGLKEKVIKEQAAQKGIYDTQTVDCTDEIALREGEVVEAKSAFKEAQFAFDACTLSKGNAEKAQTHNEEALLTKKANLKSEETLRTKQKEMFTKMDEDLSKQLSALKLALDYISSLKESQSTETIVSFPQIATNIALSGISNGNFDDVVPIIIAFTEITSQAAEDFGVAGVESSAITSIENMILDMETKMSEQRTALREDDAEDTKNFAAAQEVLGAMITKLGGELLQIGEHITDMNTCIAQESSIMGKATKKKNRNDEILGKTIIMCAAFEKEYQNAEAARVNELALLKGLRTVVVEKLGLMDDTTSKRVEEGSEGWEASDKTDYGYDSKEFSM